MNIPLHAPIPIRLLTRSGKWLLEVERYVAVRAQLFRPRRETLEGEGAILRALSAAEEVDLSNAARTLMRGGMLPERCYDVVEGGFSEAALPDDVPAALPAEERARAEDQELMRLRDQLLMLHAKVERLRMQVTDLEHGAPPTKQLPLTPAAEPPPPVLSLGSPEEHVAALDALLLGTATFSVGREDTAPGLLMIDESYFVSKLATETGECVGAVLVDEPTLERLGNVKDLAAAMVNVLAKIAGNLTVCAGDMEKLDPVELPWLFDVQKRVDLDDSLGGHVLLIGK